MPQKKKQQTQPNTEVQLAEDPSTSITVSSVEDTISPAYLPSDGSAGYIVKCGMCGTDIWTSYIDDNLVFVCGDCAETLPDE